LNKYFRAGIKENLCINGTYCLLTVKPLAQIITPNPGQFYMIGVGATYDPLLKRPFSFFRKTRYGIQFLYSVRGKGTLMMKNLKQGEVINIVGPLGNGYPLPERNSLPVFVAGGTGIASVFSLFQRLSKKACLLYGAKCREDLIMLNGMRAIKERLILCTDDGSFGERGTAVDIMKKFLSKKTASNSMPVIYACGPKPMLEAISKIALEKDLKGYISLEENMACGFGACLGCAVKTIHGYKRVCKEGPVFTIEEIVW
jgi:dihydroorotate dehydrogenase electron transfer subunit